MSSDERSGRSEVSGRGVAVEATWVAGRRLAMQASAAALGLAILLSLSATAAAKAPRIVEPILLSAPDAAAPSTPAPTASTPPAASDATATEAAAEEESMWPTVSLDTTFVSKYVWRGLVLTDGPTWQPSATVAWQGLTLNVWGNLDMDNANHLDGEFNEVDYTITYEHEIVGPLSGKIGFITYDFPNTNFHTTTELLAGLTLDVPLSPSLTAFFDLDETDGVYLLAEIGHSFELPKLADNITASAPSSMALATSLTSARVGRACWVIESNIWVAVMTGLAA